MSALEASISLIGCSCLGLDVLIYIVLDIDNTFTLQFILTSWSGTRLDARWLWSWMSGRPPQISQDPCHTNGALEPAV